MNGNVTLQKQPGLMSMWVHKFFWRMISPSNFVVIARLVVLARKDRGTRSPFSTLLDPFTLTCTLLSLRAFLRKVNIRKESSIGTGSTSFKVSPSHHYPGPRGFSWFFFAKEIKSKPRSVLKYSVYSVFCFRIFCKFRLSVYSVLQNIPCIPPFHSVLPTVRQSSA